MSETMTENHLAIDPASLGLGPATPPVAPSPPPVASAAPPAEATAEPDAATFDAARARKSAEERISALNQQYLKIHKTLAPVSQRRKDALDTLDGWRDRLRLSLNKLTASDEEVDALLNDFINIALNETPKL